MASFLVSKKLKTLHTSFNLLSDSGSRIASKNSPKLT